MKRLCLHSLYVYVCVDVSAVESMQQIQENKKNRKETATLASSIRYFPTIHIHEPIA